ncbi:MAG: hypothetical protein KC910_31720, partial [Candidatus Eremiobacteraeota bacterium]|nr:hypothetical protein [Candidatus Eremiobacteraeota bacterium]
MPVDLVDNLLDIAAGTSSPTPPPPPPVKETPLGDALKQLAKDGGALTGDQEKNLSQAWSKGEVGLVRIARPHTVVGAFANLDELKSYNALNSGGEAPPALVERFQELKAAEESGTTLFFPLQGDKVMGFLPVRTHDNWMRTDAAGAAILLARGEKLRCVDADGRVQELDRKGHLQESQANPEQ